jgi:hypothetical protein
MDAETAVRDAYGIREAVGEQLDRLFAGQRAPEGAIRVSKQPPFEGPQAHSEGADSSRRSAATLNVDPAGTLRVWVSGLTAEDGDEMYPPDGLPGYLCAEGSTYELLGDSPEEGPFLFQARTWKSLDDIIRRA